MKIVEIVPRDRAHLYDTLVEKEAAIRRAGRGTYTRIGRKVRGSTRWKHKMYKGSVQLSHGRSEVVIAQHGTGWALRPASRLANPVHLRPQFRLSRRGQFSSANNRHGAVMIFLLRRLRAESV